MSRKYSYLLEILLGIAIILFINYMWFRPNMGFVGVSPSPYWIVVIFVAARYGSFPGFMAGLAAAAALLISVSYNTALEDQLAFADIPMKQVQLSALFMLIGFLLGEERSRANLTIKRGENKYAKIRNEFEALAMEHLALKNVNTELQGRILGQTDTVNTIYEAARDLVALRVAQLYPSIVRLTRKMMKAEKCSLYIWENDSYILRSHLGWNGQIEQRRTLSTSSDIVRKAISENSIATVKDVFKSDGMKWQEGQDPCIVAPLYFGPQTDTPAGLLLIDDISFLEFNPDRVRMLKSLSDWISKSLDNAQATTVVRRKDMYDEELRVFNFNYAIRKIREEQLNTEVSGQASSVVLAKIRDYETVAESERKKLLANLIVGLRNSVRASDKVTKSPKEDVLLVILVGSDRKGSQIACDRLHAQIEKLGLKPYPDPKRGLDIETDIHVIDAEHKDLSQILGMEAGVPV